MTTNKPRKNIQGNALWFILIAIFLMASLTMLVTRTNTQTEETGDTERQTIAVTELIRYSTNLADMANTLLMRGCSESQISFEVEPADGYQNPLSPDDESCHLFKPNGTGGKRLTEFGGTTYAVRYNSRVNVTATQSGASDLVMLIEDIPQSLCDSINKVAKVPATTTPADAGAGSGVTSVPFTGSFFAGGTSITNQASADALDNHKTGCVEFTSRSIFVFFAVIIDR